MSLLLGASDMTPDFLCHVTVGDFRERHNGGIGSMEEFKLTHYRLIT